MIKIMTDNIEYIEVSMSDCVKIQRFPNKLIWDINSYLSKEYELYEYYFSKKPSVILSVRLSKLSVKNRYICFSKLDASYVSLNNYDESEYKDEYEKHKHEVEVKDYNQFFEFYSMEGIDELNYIATDNIQDSVNKLMVLLQPSWFISRNMISQKLVSTCQVSIHIGDHDYMTIYSKRPQTIIELLKIIELHKSA